MYCIRNFQYTLSLGQCEAPVTVLEGGGFPPRGFSPRGFSPRGFSPRGFSPRDRTGPDRTGPDRTGPDRTGPDRTGPDRTGPDRTGPADLGSDARRLENVFGCGDAAPHGGVQDLWIPRPF